MEIALLIGKILSGISTAQQLMSYAHQVGTIVAQAQSEGRTELTDAEKEQVRALDDAAKIRLDDAIVGHGG